MHGSFLDPDTLGPVLFWTEVFCSAIHGIARNYKTLQCTVLEYTIMHCTAIHYNIVQYTVVEIFLSLLSHSTD